MISVAMTTFNGEKYVEKQIKSVLNQSCSIDELVICDDCSTDGTVKIIEKLCLTDKRIRLYKNNKNLGYTSNFYQAISLTSGDYIFLADQDDIWEENKVEKMLTVFSELKAEVLCTNFQIIDSEDKDNSYSYIVPDYIKTTTQSIRSVDFDALIYGNVSQGCTYCFSKKIKKIFLEINNHEIIHDYQIMLIGAAFNKAYYLNEKLIKYRIHEKNSIGFSEKKTLKHIKFKFSLKKPRVVVFLEKLKSYNPPRNFWKSYVILYLRIPVWRAIFKRLT